MGLLDMHRIGKRKLAVRSLLILSLLTANSLALGQGLQDELQLAGVPALAKAAKMEGDAQRGALVFYQRHLACAKCHVAEDATQALGPNLAAQRKDATAESIVESILNPSKVIRQGYETLSIQTHDGKTFAGLLANETKTNLTLKVFGSDAALITLSKSEIDERAASQVSLMPANQANQLANRQQFLDLVKYLIEIAEGGPSRAKQLQPPASLLVLQVPEYEREIDHAGLIRDLNADSLKRGEAIYKRLCINCHGTAEQPGSLPTSLKFATGRFKNGSDPYRMYQTLTYGVGMMAPQTWMVPQQKYDVIHYIRRTYLEPLNPTQYANVDQAYLTRLPAGKTRGPAPSKIEPWVTMDYGPFLTATYEIPEPASRTAAKPLPNIAQKGIAVRLDSGPGGVSRGLHWMVFDHDTLRMAAGWSHATGGDDEGFIDWNGINFNGQHQIHPRLAGTVEFSTRPGPGWAEPSQQSWTDTRVVGRDGRRYGPLPKSWGQYRGTYQHGEHVVLSYTVGGTSILELPGMSSFGQQSLLTRTFDIGPRSQSLLLSVARHPDPNARLEGDASRKNAGVKGPLEVARVLVPRDVQQTLAKKPNSHFDGTSHIDIQDGEHFDFVGNDYSVTARIRAQQDGTIFSHTNATGPWVPNGKALFVRGGKLCFDVGWVGVVTSKRAVGDGKWHQVTLTWKQQTGEVRLYVDGQVDATGVLKLLDKQVASATFRLGFAAEDFPTPSHFQGDIERVRFYQRVLTDKEVRSAPVDQGKPNRMLGDWDLKGTGEVVTNKVGAKGRGKTVRGSGQGNSATEFLAGISGATSSSGMRWQHDAEQGLQLEIPAGTEPLRFTLAMLSKPAEQVSDAVLEARTLTNQPVADVASFTQGGPRRWPEELLTDVERGDNSGPFAADILTLPSANPWFCQLRLTGLDFFPDGDRMAVCSWDGDVWLISGLKNLDQAPTAKKQLKWRRIASGLFQPLGLLIVQDRIHLTCRDQLVILNDLNGDGETDFYECFNNDHQVTEHFHEFAMGLQRDAKGNFYYAKSARHALTAVVPHHGTLLRVSPDGARTDILAVGFRAANGVCLNEDGSFFVTDQEGHWNPKNRINWVREGEFYGNMFGYHDVWDSSDSAMEQPLCWITNSFDRSPAELVWVNSDRWGPLRGALLNLSYGTGKIFVVPHERRGKVMQGGMTPLPLPAFPTGIHRGRFHPGDGQLYLCGMFAWAGNAILPGGLYRVRYTGKPVHVVTGLAASNAGVSMALTGAVDHKAAENATNYSVKTWSLRRTQNYGSEHHDENSLQVKSARISDDGKTITLEIPELRPTWCMEITYSLKSTDGEPIRGVINNTIHQLQD